MTNTERDKAIWEALGKHWHDYQWVTGIPWICNCGDKCDHYDLWKENPDFSADPGKVMLLREVMKLDDFYLFRRYIVDRCLGGDDETDYFLTYITDTTGKLMNEVFDWMVATGRISGIG